MSDDGRDVQPIVWLFSVARQRIVTAMRQA